MAESTSGDHKRSKRHARRSAVSRPRNAGDDAFYRTLEEEFRGPQKLIRSRLEIYFPFIDPLKTLAEHPTAIDLGCGRGEWLELLRERGYQARGVDIDEGMLAASREKGLDVERKDAVKFLQALPHNSQLIVSAFHVAEHLPFLYLKRLVQEAFRVLKPGGLLLLETPNPENIKVSSVSFYLDPTHRHPLPPKLLSFLPKYHGFARVKIVRLQEKPNLFWAKQVSLDDVLGGASPDYAVIGQKSCDEAVARLFDSAFEKELGISGEALVNRFDQRLAAGDARVAALAARFEAERDGRVALEGSLGELRRQNAAHLETLAKAVAVWEAAQKSLKADVAARDAELTRMREALAGSDAQAKALEIEVQNRDNLLAAVYGSESWRITRPLRCASSFARWFVRGSWAWLSFKQGSRPRRVARLARWLPAVERRPSRSWDWLAADAPNAAHAMGLPIPQSLFALWLVLGPDSAKQFPLHSQRGASAFLGWWLRHGAREFAGAAADVLPLLSNRLDEPAPGVPQDAPLPLTRLAVLVHAARPDLQHVFDLADAKGRTQFAWWWLNVGANGLPKPVAEMASAQLAALASEPAPGVPQDAPLPLTRLAVLVHAERSDLQRVFDLKLPAGRRGLIDWWLTHGVREYAFLPQHIGRGTKPVVLEDTDDAAHARTDTVGTSGAAQADEYRRGGVNFVGIAYGELGLGEDVRMAARSATAAGVPRVIFNYPRKVSTRTQDYSAAAAVSDRLVYGANIFCGTGFETLRAYGELGRAVFDRRYSVGYWAWELPEWPKQAAIAFNLVDEVWASSRYTAEAYRRATAKPVRLMPMAVTVDRAEAVPRGQLDLPQDRFLFLFAFDANSHFARKNPAGAIKAFQRAFPRRRDVGLVLKVMNADKARAEWRKILDSARHDDRIVPISETLSRSRVLGLIRACDAFVSLHRAEGFGRLLAEALLLERPVVATNFSGNVDFTSDETAFMVDGPMVQLSAEDYPFGDGQYWCDPDIAMAAEQMARCFTDRAEAARRTAAGKALLEQRHNPRAVGGHYLARLRELNLF